jgi:uncharacterized protein
MAAATHEARGLERRWRRVALALLAVVAACVLALPDALAQKFPALTGRIVDEAGLLKAEDRAAIEATLRELEGKSSDQVVVYTTRSLQGYPIEDFGYRLGRHWGIGQRATNNGIVLIVAPTERRVRIEVGRGLEPQMTDAMSKLIIENAILPAFRSGDFAKGIRDGVRDIKDVLLGDAAEVERRRAAAPKPSNAPDTLELIILLLFVAMFIYLFTQSARHARSLPPSARRKRHGDGNVIVFPGGWGGSGGWSGGSGGGGSWSGGGGSFGGGGSSGSW